MAKEQVFTVFSGNPDDFGVGFLDDFDGTYVEACYIAHPFKSGKHGLFWRVRIRPDDSEDILTYHLRAGFLGTYVPSQDGKSPAGATLDEYKELAKAGPSGPSIEEGTEDEYSGPYAIAPGSNPKPLPPSDYHQHLFCLRELGWKTIDPRADAVVGLHCHFNRLSVDERIVETASGKKVQINQKMPAKEGDKETTEWKVICPTAILEPVKGSKSTTSKSTSTSSSKSATSKAETSDAEDEGQVMDMMLEMDIAGVLTEAGEPIPRNKIVELMKPKFGEYDSNEAKQNALLKMSNVKWMNHEDRPWTFEGGKYSVKE